MKKYVILLLGTLAAVGLIFGVRAAVAPREVAVTLHALEAQSVRQTVECNGKVQLADSREVYVELPCVAREIYVKEGQHVNKGDALFSVDVEATQQVLSQLGGSVSNANTESLRSTVTAPVSGTVKALNVQKGKLADSTAPCAVISSGSRIRVAVTVREKYVSRIAVGQAVEVSGVAFKKDLYHGTITQIGETAHQEYMGAVSETVVDAVVALDEEDVDASLRSGLNARATVVTDVLENALLVPYNCIGQNEEGQEFVYVCQNDTTAVRVTPEFGAECADGVLVLSGLAPGDRLVQNPEALSDTTVSVRVE